MQPDKEAADYGESDIEAKAMEQASSHPKPSSARQATGAEPKVQRSGTSETDIEKNVREKKRREKNN